MSLGLTFISMPQRQRSAVKLPSHALKGDVDEEEETSFLKGMDWGPQVGNPKNNVGI